MTVGMSMRRRALVLVVLGTLSGPAIADTFGGFSGVDRPYLVNADKVCTPLLVTGGTATGAPACTKATADVIARLSMKDPIPQSGAKATFAATASGRTLTVTRKAGGTPVVSWTAPDAIKSVVDVYASAYEDRVAVAYLTRRAGKQVTDVVGFDLGRGAAPPPATDPNAPTVTAPPPATPPSATAPADPRIVKAVATARKAKGAKAVTAWKGVLALDAGNAEALYRLAAAQLAAKQRADALATLATLAASPRAEAIEWRIEARFDRAFASVRADPAFRGAVGLDQRGTSAYERLMGFGGQWEQTGTSCDKPEIRFTALRDRTFKLRVKSTCQGSVFEMPFKGTWRIEGTRVVLALPNKGKVTAEDEAACELQAQGDEDALHCVIGRDLDFTVLPVRR